MIPHQVLWKQVKEMIPAAAQYVRLEQDPDIHPATLQVIIDRNPPKPLVDPSGTAYAAFVGQVWNMVRDNGFNRSGFGRRGKKFWVDFTRR